MADRQVRRRLSEEEMNRDIGMLGAWLLQRAVARVLGVSQSVVSRMWTRFHLTGNVMHQHAGGCERSTIELKTDLSLYKPDVTGSTTQQRYVANCRTLPVFV